MTDSRVTAADKTGPHEEQGHTNTGGTAHPVDAVPAELRRGAATSTTVPPSPQSRFAKVTLKIWRRVASPSTWRAVVGLVAFVFVWETLANLDAWIDIRAPIVGDLPPPTEVGATVGVLMTDPTFYWSAYMSFRRVMLGFIWAMIIGIPFGLLMATSKWAKDVFFTPFEILRPIPPLAWVPAAIIFWPTQEMSIAFVTFIGAFYTVVLNTVGGGEQIDRRYKLAARSMGASGFTMFRRVILPGALPSIATGAVVGMGITWEVVVAAEMISGGGQGAMSGSGGGLGFTIWNSYLGGAIPQVIVTMVALGFLGYFSSGLVRLIGKKAMPWKAEL